MMVYVRAEREYDWPLHLQAVKLMMLYFFVFKHINYARYGLYYLRSMEALPANVLEYFMKGAHVMRHRPGLWKVCGVTCSLKLLLCSMDMGKLA